jgi:vWA found in TerF C terminus
MRSISGMNIHPGAKLVAARTINLRKDPSGAPAVNLTKVREAGHIDLVKRAEKAGISLSKRNLSGLRGAVRLYVDHSRSMEFSSARDYSNGNVQRLVERALGYAFQLDSDGKIPVIAFDSELWPEVIVDQSNYEGVVEAKIWHPRKMGGTKFVPILKDLLNEAKSTDEPIFAIIVTDGSPSDRTKATRLVIELARYPVQIKFLAIREAGYLTELDDLEERHPGARLLDNVNAKFFDGNDCPKLTDITDLQFADAMADEIDTWVHDAIAKGVLSA